MAAFGLDHRGLPISQAVDALVGNDMERKAPPSRRLADMQLGIAASAMRADIFLQVEIRTHLICSVRQPSIYRNTPPERRQHQFDVAPIFLYLTNYGKTQNQCRGHGPRFQQDQPSRIGPEPWSEQASSP